MIRQRDAAHWRPTAALVAALAFGAPCLLLAVLLRRLDLLLLAAPMVLGVALAMAGRPYDPPDIALRTRADTLLENQLTDVIVTVRTDETIDVAAVRVSLGGWLQAARGRPIAATVVRAGVAREVPIRIRSIRWGRSGVGPATVVLTAAHGYLARGPFVTPAVAVTTLPLQEGFQATDAVPKASGMVGLHRSRRPGEGTDLAGVRPFVTGDKLRRINWSVSMRTGALHVTSTMSDRDTDVVLVIDSKYDLGESGGVDGSASSLDTTVRAAASIAEHYLRHGDRVGLIDLSQAFRQIRPATGRTHLTRLLDVLLDVAPSRGSGLAATVALGELTPGSLVLMLSPLVGDHAMGRVAALARSGQSVLVVDTLPADAVPPRRSEWTPIAHRVWRLEREVDIARLAELGVPVVAWRGAGSLDEVLRDVSRAAAAPRALR